MIDSTTKLLTNHKVHVVVLYVTTSVCYDQIQVEMLLTVCESQPKHSYWGFIIITTQSAWCSTVHNNVHSAAQYVTTSVRACAMIKDKEMCF